jgi:phenylpyruvate tautomerase PptA (4-oxalocrotonate tautomerase family)
MRVSLSAKLTEEQKQSLYEKLGEALRHIPGKEPFMLIAEIADGLQFYAFGKKQENFAFVDARYFSRVEYHAKRDFAVAVMKAIEETAGTKSTNISMNIFELSTWGGFGDLNDEFYKDPGADENRQSAHGEGED